MIEYKKLEKCPICNLEEKVLSDVDTLLANGVFPKNVIQVTIAKHKITLEQNHLINHKEHIYKQIGKSIEKQGLPIMSEGGEVTKGHPKWGTQILKLLNERALVDYLLQSGIEDLADTDQILDSFGPKYKLSTINQRTMLRASLVTMLKDKKEIEKLDRAMVGANRDLFVKILHAVRTVAEASLPEEYRDNFLKQLSDKLKTVPEIQELLSEGTQQNGKEQGQEAATAGSGTESAS